MVWINLGSDDKTIAHMVLISPGPSIATIIMAISSEGMDKAKSRIWFKILDLTPSLRPAKAPSMMPNIMAINTDKILRPKVKVAPLINLDKRSRPKSSVPSMYSILPSSLHAGGNNSAD